MLIEDGKGNVIIGRSPFLLCQKPAPRMFPLWSIRRKTLSRTRNPLLLNIQSTGTGRQFDGVGCRQCKTSTRNVVGQVSVPQTNHLIPELQSCIHVLYSWTAFLLILTRRHKNMYWWFVLWLNYELKAHYQQRAHTIA